MVAACGRMVIPFWRVGETIGVLLAHVSDPDSSGKIVRLQNPGIASPMSSWPASVSAIHGWRTRNEPWASAGTTNNISRLHDLYWVGLFDMAPTDSVK